MKMRRVQQMTTGLDARFEEVLSRYSFYPRAFREAMLAEYEANVDLYRDMIKDRFPGDVSEGVLDQGIREFIDKNMPYIAYEDYRGILGVQASMTDKQMKALTSLDIDPHLLAKLNSDSEPLDFDAFMERGKILRVGTASGRSRFHWKQPALFRRISDAVDTSSAHSDLTKIRKTKCRPPSKKLKDIDPSNVLPLLGVTVQSTRERVREGFSKAPVSTVVGVTPKMRLVLDDGQEVSIHEQHVVGRASDRFKKRKKKR